MNSFENIKESILKNIVKEAPPLLTDNERDYHLRRPVDKSINKLQIEITKQKDILMYLKSLEINIKLSYAIQYETNQLMFSLYYIKILELIQQRNKENAIIVFEKAKENAIDYLECSNMENSLYLHNSKKIQIFYLYIEYQLSLI